MAFSSNKKNRKIYFNDNKNRVPRMTRRGSFGAGPSRSRAARQLPVGALLALRRRGGKELTLGYCIEPDRVSKQLLAAAGAIDGAMFLLR